MNRCEHFRHLERTSARDIAAKGMEQTPMNYVCVGTGLYTVLICTMEGLC